MEFLLRAEVKKKKCDSSQWQPVGGGVGVFCVGPSPTSISLLCVFSFAFWSSSWLPFLRMARCVSLSSSDEGRDARQLFFKPSNYFSTILWAFLGGVTDRKPPVPPEVSGSNPPRAKHPCHEYTDPIKLGGCNRLAPPPARRERFLGTVPRKKTGPPTPTFRIWIWAPKRRFPRTPFNL